ncbi:MAG TPA: beta-propeller domain-containing protein, partial [Oscillospiraceae bacterium]|nr:beta-propeller domain-containing protein [Oscillospiraceae bacterium]
KKHENNNELTNINETLKKAENLTLPSSLSEESINELLGSQKPAYTFSKNSKRKRAIAFAAVLAIVFSTLIYTKPWQNSVTQTPKAPIKNLSGKVEVPNTPLSYKQLEDLFIKYQNANARKWYSFDFSMGAKPSDSATPEAGGEYNEIKNELSGIGNDESTSYGKTNEQVAGVNEADIIKNDGAYIYMTVKGNDFFYDYDNDESVTGKREVAPDTNIGGMSAPYNPKAKNSIAIIKPSISGQMQVMSTISAEIDSGITYQNIINMYVKGNRLHAIYDVYGKEHLSSVLVVTFDITNKQKPLELRRFYQSGSHISTRLIENSLILITNHHVAMYDGSDSIKDYCVPETGTVFEDTSRIPVNNICIMESAASPSYLVASNINLDKPDTSPATAAILGAGENVYSTKNSLYVTNGEWNQSFADVTVKSGLLSEDSIASPSADTSIYAFDIANGNVIYRATKSINGSVLNQFSIDEYDGHLRIATTTGNFEKANNFVYVLSADTLEQVGIIKDIAPGESIKSVRFMGGRGYVVTFLQTDPLFVIDLANPSAPKILGELKITGFSSYLHPISSTLLAGIGVDGTETGQNNNLKVSLFDVSDPSKPKEVDKAVFGNGTVSQYADSTAYYDHKAISYDDKENIFYFPLQIHDYIYTSGNNKVTTGIIGLKIDTQNKTFSKISKYLIQKSDYTQIIRSTYIDNLLFAFSNSFVYSFDRAKETALSQIDFTKYDFPKEYTPRPSKPVPTTEVTSTEVTTTKAVSTTEKTDETTFANTSESVATQSFSDVTDPSESTTVYTSVFETVITN